MFDDTGVTDFDGVVKLLESESRPTGKGIFSTPGVGPRSFEDDSSNTSDVVCTFLGEILGGGVSVGGGGVVIG